MDDGLPGGLGVDLGAEADVVDVPGFGPIRIEREPDGREPDHADQLHALGNGVVDLGAAYALTVLWARLDIDPPPP